MIEIMRLDKMDEILAEHPDKAEALYDHFESVHELELKRFATDADPYTAFAEGLAIGETLGVGQHIYYFSEGPAQDEGILVIVTNLLERQIINMTEYFMKEKSDERQTS